MIRSLQTNLTLDELARQILQAQRFWITTHAKPDGDAFGSVLALAEALRQLDKSVDAFVAPPVPAALSTLDGADGIALVNQSRRVAEPELVLVLDTGAWAQLAPQRPILEPHLNRMVIVDHHLSGDVPAAHCLIDSQAAACCEPVAQLIDKLSLAANGDADRLYNPIVRQALFVGLASDTGWFRFSNTRPLTHELAARLQRLGVDHAQLYSQLEQTERPEKLSLLIHALDSLQLLADGQIALMTLTASDFAKTGAILDETERLVDYPQIVRSVQVVILVTQISEDVREPIRLSFRSKPGNHAVNVAALAQRFGGGGHARAAGAKIQGHLEQVLVRLKENLFNLPRD